LALAHLGVVCLAAAASTLVAVALGILLTRPSGAQFLPLSRTLVNVGQTFPPVAVLAVTVPIVGFGEQPTLIALFAYILLPRVAGGRVAALVAVVLYDALAGLERRVCRNVHIEGGVESGEGRASPSSPGAGGKPVRGGAIEAVRPLTPAAGCALAGRTQNAWP